MDERVENWGCFNKVNGFFFTPYPIIFMLIPFHPNTFPTFAVRYIHRGYRSPLTFLETFPSSPYMSGCYVPASWPYHLLSTPVFEICEYTTEFTLNWY